MDDYIKREDAINTIRNTFTGMTADTLELRINDIPSADAAPVRHGRWAETVTDGFLFVSCSACGFKTGRIDYNYCPNCGTKMDREETNE